LRRNYYRWLAGIRILHLPANDTMHEVHNLQSAGRSEQTENFFLF